MSEQAASGKGGVLNDRTYQEVDYLKKNLGLILVAALSEVCIRRPADPIEYLGHWLLRWRYNEELKRRDVQNALEVVRQKAGGKNDEMNTAPDTGSSYPPPGYGGPLEDGAGSSAAAADDTGSRKSGGNEADVGAEEDEEKRVSLSGEDVPAKRASEEQGGAAEDEPINDGRKSGGELEQGMDTGAEEDYPDKAPSPVPEPVSDDEPANE